MLASHSFDRTRGRADPLVGDEVRERREGRRGGGREERREELLDVGAGVGLCVVGLGRVAE